METTPSAEGREYSLALSRAEMARYQLMAERARATEADLWQRAGIVAGAKVADVGCGPGALLPALPEDVELTDLQQRYLTFHTARGNDVLAGLRLGERLGRAGLELVDFRGTYVIGPVPPGMRQPPWAARDAMVAAGLATEQDVARWARAFDRFDAAAPRPTLFAPMFIAVGRRPA